MIYLPGWNWYDLIIARLMAFQIYIMQNELELFVPYSQCELEMLELQRKAREDGNGS